MASRALNRIRDFNRSSSRSRRGQECERNHDQHNERTGRDRQRTDRSVEHVERRSKDDSSGKQKRSKTKSRTVSPAKARSRSPLEETQNDEAEVRPRPRWRERSPPVTRTREARDEVERAPAWADKCFNLKQVSERRLEELELSMKRATNKKPMVEDPQASCIFTKKLYQEQFSFHHSIAQKLVEACSLLDDSNVSVQELLQKDMGMIKTRNTLSVINDKYGYETGQAYAKDPLEENSEDERKIKRARKEVLHVKEQ